MPIRGIRKPDEEIDCIATIAGSESIRAFLRLPSQRGAGRLRLVEMPSVPLGDGRIEDVQLQLLEHHDSQPGCLPNCFVRSRQIGMPVSAPYPLELAINSAIIGSANPNETYGSLAVLSQGATSFLDAGSSSLADIASAGALRVERASAPFGTHRLQLFEIAERSAPGGTPEVTFTWSVELLLTGSHKPLGEWADAAMPALSLISFCLDKPLSPELVYSATESRRADLH